MFSALSCCVCGENLTHFTLEFQFVSSLGWRKDHTHPKFGVSGWWGRDTLTGECVVQIFQPPSDNQSSVRHLAICCMFSNLLSHPRDASHMLCFLHKGRSWSSRIPAQTNESVELLGKEHSSDQCHMMQEVCQHFSSSSLAIGRGMYSLPGSKGWIMEASHEPGDILQPLYVAGSELVSSSLPHPARKAFSDSLE